MNLHYNFKLNDLDVLNEYRFLNFCIYRVGLYYDLVVLILLTFQSVNLGLQKENIWYYENTKDYCNLIMIFLI